MNKELEKNSNNWIQHQEQHVGETTHKLFKDKARHDGEIIADRRLAPPPNSILAGFVMADAPCTTPRSYAAPLSPSI